MSLVLSSKLTAAADLSSYTGSNGSINFFRSKWQLSNDSVYLEKEIMNNQCSLTSSTTIEDKRQALLTEAWRRLG
jgi:hypothetical protein